jgi:hypothetical protein
MADVHLVLVLEVRVERRAADLRAIADLLDADLVVIAAVHEADERGRECITRAHGARVVGVTRDGNGPGHGAQRYI